MTRSEGGNVKENRYVQKLCVSALLIALGIVIPMFMPLKLVIPPASFTLASHVPIFLAMMISPLVAVSVSLGTTLGFLIGGFPIVIVLRAASHLVFALLGALYISKDPGILHAGVRTQVFAFFLSLLHAAGEVAVVTCFYLGGGMAETYYQSGLVQSVFLLVGLGTVIHSMVDFEIAFVVAKALRRQKGRSSLLA